MRKRLPEKESLWSRKISSGPCPAGEKFVKIPEGDVEYLLLSLGVRPDTEDMNV